MDKLQNSSLNGQSLYEPMAYMALALLAGKTRLIELFPKSSPAGLAFIAGMTASSAIAYDATVRKPEHETYWTIVGKIAFSSIGFFAVVAFAKPLKGRISLTPNASFRFIFLCWFPMLPIVIKTQEFLRLQALHNDFNLNPMHWKRLTNEERTNNGVEFMNAGLFALPSGFPINGDNLDNTRFPDPNGGYKLRPAELSWSLAVNNRNALWFPSVNNALPLRSIENAKGQLLLWKNKGIIFHDIMISADKINSLSGDRKIIDLLHDYFTNHPQLFYSMDDAQQKAFNILFAGKSPIPHVNPSLTPYEVMTMDNRQLCHWAKCIKSDKNWENVSATVRSIVIRRLLVLSPRELLINFPEKCYEGLPDTSWILDITPDEINALDTFRFQVSIYNYIFKNNKVDMTRFTNEQIAAFKNRGIIT